MITHEISLDLATGARLALHYFSDRELRWIFRYRYVGDKKPGKQPDLVNDVSLVADYASGLLSTQLLLSMHIILPRRLGQIFFAGMDISPGAKTYLEFNYARSHARDIPEYRLVEICKGAKERVRLDTLDPALMRPIAFPFPVPDSLPIKHGTLQVPFLTNENTVSHFDLPARTLR